jgi:NAD(P)-dependent dehydrogenase (short-subunit alcohol dehydrogenase family)
LGSDYQLDGAVAVVVGALGKLGPTWVSALAGAGATVVGVDLAAADPPSGAAKLEQADATDRDALQSVGDRVMSEFGPPRVLINSAGIDQPPEAEAGTHRIEDVPSEDFRRTVDVNLTGTFHSIQVFGAPMRDAGRGSIVNIGSLYASIAPDPALYEHMDLDPPFLKPPAYGASKAGVISLTRYFARLWGPDGVRVNALSPGGVRGEQDATFLEKYSSRVPLRRMADQDDLAGPLLFLASDASRYVTGHELRVDGGFTV